MPYEKYPAISTLKNINQFAKHLLSLQIAFDPRVVSENTNQTQLSSPYALKNGFSIGNRFCIHPMEGWDGTPDGKPTEYTQRRWQNFGKSGAKLIWGGEAVAVQPDGRANPNQLLINQENQESLSSLRQALITEHENTGNNTDDLYIGLQLTHSGRFAKPNHKTILEPQILYHHPYLEEKFHTTLTAHILTDDEIENIIANFIDAAVMASEIGFHFVDVKHCHGYLGHEFLTAHNRPGPFGGSFENRTRFLREVVTGIRKKAPNLQIGVRLSAFDLIAFEKDADSGIGMPVSSENYLTPFGASQQDFCTPDLSEPIQFLQLLNQLGIELVNLTAGSPYYNPHIQRPALFPPSDGYLPPEDPLVGVFRQIQVAAELKKAVPELGYVGSAYTYLQEWLPAVAQNLIAADMIDFVGIGRMVLSYPEFPHDCLNEKPLNRRKICRTFSDCTTAPRKGLISGCYPLDHFYKLSPENEQLINLKKKVS